MAKSPASNAAQLGGTDAVIAAYNQTQEMGQG